MRTLRDYLLAEARVMTRREVARAHELARGGASGEPANDDYSREHVRFLRRWLADRVRRPGYRHMAHELATQVGNIERQVDHAARRRVRPVSEPRVCDFSHKK